MQPLERRGRAAQRTRLLCRTPPPSLVAPRWWQGWERRPLPPKPGGKYLSRPPTTLSSDLLPRYTDGRTRLLRSCLSKSPNPWAQHGGKKHSFWRQIGCSLEDPSVSLPSSVLSIPSPSHFSGVKTYFLEGNLARKLRENALAPHMHGGRWVLSPWCEYGPHGGHTPWV